MRFEAFSFGSICIDGSSADHKPPALPGYLLLYRERCMPKPIAEPFGRFFLALADAATVYHDVIPLGALPAMEEVNREARRRKIKLQILPTAEAIKILEERPEGTNAILHLTC